MGIFLDTQSGKPIQDVYTSGTFDLLSSTSNVTINFSDSETLTAYDMLSTHLQKLVDFEKLPVIVSHDLFEFLEMQNSNKKDFVSLNSR